MEKILRNSTKKIKILCLKTITGIADAFKVTKRFRSDPPKNCLIISTTGIGDTVWATPAIRTLKEEIPSLRLSVLANVNGAETLMGNPFIDEILIFKKGIFNCLSLLKKLANYSFDTVIVFHATDRIIWLMAYLTGAGKIIGSRRHSKETYFVITHPVDIPHNTHAIYARFLLTREVGVKTALKKIELFITDDERNHIEEVFKDKEISQNSLLIGFQPGAAKLYKRWPEKNFIELGKMLSRIRRDVQVIITGNKEEKQLSQTIADEIGGISLAGRLNLRETSAAIERCNLFITNDTGPMHIAVALGIPTIALFSATGVENVEPYRTLINFTAITKPKPCKECISKACTEPVCMEQISPEEVFKIVEEQINLQRIQGV